LSPLSSLLHAFLLAGCQGAGPSAASIAPQAVRIEAPARLALLVGIDRYAPGTPENFLRLLGCVRDVRLAEQVLQRRFGFPSESIRVLLDDQATHAGIVQAFRDHLVARAGPDTEVVFWYSGHGSRVPDQSRAAAAEIDAKDATFVAYDSRAEGQDGAYDIADDELRSLLAALSAKTSRITVVTDSCHSGGATRGARVLSTPRIRSVEDGARPVDRERLLTTFWPKGIPLLDDGDAVMLAAPAYVHIAACSPRQVAQEIDAEDEDGRTASHGALSFFLVQRLLEVQPNCSYRSLADDVAVVVATRYPDQHVWAEGALSRDVFGSRFEPQPSGFRARATSSGEIKIEAGAMHGLRKGSVLALYRTTGGERIGSARVERVQSVHSAAGWLEPVPAEVPVGALRAVEETRPAAEEPLAVFVADPELARLLAKSQRARVEADPARAEYALEREAGGALAFVGPGGLRIWRDSKAADLAQAALVERLELEFREELRYRALVGLATEHGALGLGARFVAPSSEELGRFAKSQRFERCSDAGARVEAAGHAAPAGAVFRAIGTRVPQSELALAILEVENRSDRGVHVAVLSVSEDRLRNLIWPAEGEKDRVLEPGASVRVPVNVVSNPAWKEPRPMRDRYLVLGTLEAADFTPLVRTESTTRSAQAAVRMPPILALALERPETRGVRQASTDRSAFGLAVVDLFVDPPFPR